MIMKINVILDHYFQLFAHFQIEFKSGKPGFWDVNTVAVDDIILSQGG